MIRHTPQQNCVVERMNVTLLERARCMISITDSPLVNKSPSTTIKCKTPKEIWSAFTTNYSIFLYVWVSNLCSWNKTGTKSQEICIFLGYRDGIKRYKLWDSKETKFMIIRYVSFDEATIFKSIPHKDHDVANKKVKLEVEIPKKLEKREHVFYG